MTSVQSFINSKVKCGEFPAPKGAEAFAAYAIASAKDLIPEMENAARLTLDHPMTFETLGEGLRLFEGSALRNLVSFRKRCRDNLVKSLSSFSPNGPPIPRRAKQLLLRTKNDLKLQIFTHSLDMHLRMRQEATPAVQEHVLCTFCLGTHSANGPVLFCTDLENKMAEALNKVTYSYFIPFPVPRDLPLVGTQ
jgi:hypothetical protein